MDRVVRSVELLNRRQLLHHIGHQQKHFFGVRVMVGIHHHGQRTPPASAEKCPCVSTTMP